jgi:dienelactone hydrolase
VRITDIEYSHRGRRLVGQLAVDDSRIGARPAVLVCHEGNGLSEHSKRAAERLAELGYVAFALDYYGDGAVLAPEDMPDRFAEISSDPELTRGIAAAGLAELLASEYTDPTRVAAIGFCFGGTMALELARAGTDLRAVVGFHSGLGAVGPIAEAGIGAKVLVAIGASDPWVPAEQRAAFEREMTDAGVDWQLLLLGGNVHSFTNPAVDALENPALRYDAAAEARAWRAVLGLFDEVF